MAITIPLLISRKNKAGRTSYYWQPSATLRKAGFLPVALGRNRATAFDQAGKLNEQVEAWKGGDAMPEHIRRRAKAGTVSALIASYRREILEGKQPNGRDYLKPATRDQYRPSLERLEAWGGAKSIDWVTRSRVKELKNRLIGPEEKGGIGHHAAYATLKMGRTLFRFAEDADLIDPNTNPFDRFGLAAPDPRATIWSLPARTALVAAAAELELASLELAIRLGFAIGQRPQDFRALLITKYVAIPPDIIGTADYAALAALAPDGVVRGLNIRQLKTKGWPEIPIVGELRALLEAAIARAKAAGSTTILIDEKRGGNYAGPAGKTRFNRDFAAIRERAIAAAIAAGDDLLAGEIAGLQFRDLRRTCVVYHAEHGLEVHQIVAITGHDIDETTEILKTYMPRTTARAASAVAIMAAREAQRALQHAAKG